MTNTGTSQPKFDARVDYDPAAAASSSFAGGVAGTEGIIHSGIGPFDISQGSRLTYFTGRYERGRGRVAFFTNLLNGDAINLLSRGTNGQFLPLDVRHADLRRRSVGFADARPTDTS